MKLIQTIESFIDALNNCSPEDYIKIVRKLELRTSALASYESWGKSMYSRNCIARTKHYELILICWEKKAETSIHGHNNQRCWVYPVEGQIAERRYQMTSAGALEECHHMVLRPGRLAYMHDSMGYHSLHNVCDGRAMTLHLYASPIDQCKVYDSEAGTFFDKSLSYDTVVEKVESGKVESEK